MKYIFDFDSTFVKSEGLEEIAEIALADKEDKLAVLNSISEITKKGMNGEISITDSIDARLKVMGATREDVEKVTELVKTQVSDSIRNHKEFFLENSKDIYIFSGGFRDFILPVAIDYGLSADHVYANTFLFDEDDKIIGFDKSNYLGQARGKAMQLMDLNLEDKVVAIGDGWSDYEMREQGEADYFVAFVENVRREKVVKHADLVAESFVDVIEWTESIKN